MKRTATVHEICERARPLLQTDLKAAARHVDVARRIARRTGDPLALAEVLRMDGHVRYLSGAHLPARRSYQRAVRFFESAGQEIEAARTRSSALQTLMYLGRCEEALDWAERSRKVFVQAGDELRLARLKSNLGNVLQYLERHTEAIVAHEEAAEELARLGDLQNSAIARSNLALARMEAGEFAKALDTYERALAFFRESGMTFAAAVAAGNIAYIRFARGEYSAALATYADTPSVGDSLSQRTATLKLDLAELYLHLNCLSESSAASREAAAHFKSLGSRFGRARALTLDGHALLLSGDWSSALERFNQARTLFVREGIGTWLALNHLDRAGALLAGGRLTEAKKLADHASGLLQSSHIKSRAVLAHLVSGRIGVRQGDTRMAVRKLRIVKKLGHRLTLPLRFSVCQFEGECLEASGDARGALRAWRKSADILELLRRNVVHDDLRIVYLRDKQGVYESLFSVAYSLGRAPSQLLVYAESAKSRSLADSMLRGNAAGPEDELTQARQRLTILYRKRNQTPPIGDDKGKRELRRLDSRIRDCEAALGRLWTLGKRRAPSPTSDEVFDLDVERVRNLLSPDESILQYFIARGQMYAFTIDREGIECASVAPLSSVATLSRMLRLQMGSYGRLHGRENDGHQTPDTLVKPHLKRLYDVLVRPVVDRLQTERWTIVPHGALHSLPFHAFHDGQSYIAEQRSVAYAPSLRVLYVAAQKAPTRNSSSLIIAAPDSGAPAMEHEARMLARMLPGARLRLAGEHPLDALRSSGPQYRYLHIAAHGLFRRDNPLFSAVLLGNDRLNLVDLYGLQLDADLVTLSGCGTGLSEPDGDGEVLGLTRGLLSAGARAVHLSLWDVADAVAFQYMRSFYKNLLAGISPPEASRLAMLRVKASAPHPFYWAPFVVTGGFSFSLISRERPIFPVEASAPN